MRLITLNIWGGKVFGPLMEFVEGHAGDADIFCMQEVIFGPRSEIAPVSKGRMNICEEIVHRLPEFSVLAYSAPEEAYYFEAEKLPEDTHPGLVIFVKKSIGIVDHGGFRCYEEGIPAGADFGGKMTGSCQWVRIRKNDGSESTIMNLHGLWQTKTEKADTPERIAQSHILRRFLDEISGEKMLCGDFNLKPDGQSLTMLEQGMVNLVKTSGATSTRSSLYTKPDKFADYILVSPDIQAKHFEVLQNEVSDHLPLLVDWA